MVRSSSGRTPNSRASPTPITAVRARDSSSKEFNHRPDTSGTSSTTGRSSLAATTGIGTVSYFSRASSYGVTMMLVSSTIGATASTVVTVSARSTTSTGRVGSCPPNELDADASTRLVPSSATLAFRSPLAESVRPTAAMMAATPIIGPSRSNRVRTLRASSPTIATRTRSRKTLIGAPRRSRFDRRAWTLCALRSWRCPCHG